MIHVRWIKFQVIWIQKYFSYISVADNKTNPSFCIKHSTRQFRYEVSRGNFLYKLTQIRSWADRIRRLAESNNNFSGQPKYCLDIKFDVKSSKSTKEKQKVFLAADQTYQKISKKKKIEVLSSDYDFFKMVEDNINGKLDRSKLTEDDLEKLRLGWKFLFF